jgi:hypothetical protein
MKSEATLLGGLWLLPRQDSDGGEVDFGGSVFIAHTMLGQLAAAGCFAAKKPLERGRKKRRRGVRQLSVLLVGTGPAASAREMLWWHYVLESPRRVPRLGTELVVDALDLSEETLSHAQRFFDVPLRNTWTGDASDVVGEILEGSTVPYDVVIHDIFAADVPVEQMARTYSRGELEKAWHLVDPRSGVLIVNVVLSSADSAAVSIIEQRLRNVSSDISTSVFQEDAPESTPIRNVAIVGTGSGVPVSRLRDAMASLEQSCFLRESPAVVQADALSSDGDDPLIAALRQDNVVTAHRAAMEELFPREWWESCGVPEGD